MGWYESNAALLYLEPQEFFLKREEDHHALFLWSVSLSFMSMLCNRLFLLFQALEALALTEEDRGPQQVENFILGIEEEEGVEDEEEGSEVFINNKPSGLLKLRCFLYVTQIMTASPSRSLACKHDPMQYLHHLSAMGLQGNTQREI